jgi:hypothetical protein
MSSGNKTTSVVESATQTVDNDQEFRIQALPLITSALPTGGSAQFATPRHVL